MDKILKIPLALRIPLIFFLIIAWVFSGFPQIFNFPPGFPQAYATHGAVENVTSESATPGDTTVTVNWTNPANNDGISTSDPSSNNDLPRSIAIDSDFVYIAGEQDTGGECSTGSTCWRIEKRNINTGALVAAFDTNGIVTVDPTSGTDILFSIAVDSSFIYVAGSQATGGECATGGNCWRIEKRDITSGALVAAFDTDGIVTVDPTNGDDEIRSIAVDSSFIYVAGFQGTGGDCSTGGNCSRIEKRDITTGALVAAFDSDGIVTSDPTASGERINSIAIDSSFIYVAGKQGAGSGCATGNDCWRIEKRDITSGALVAAFHTDGIITSDPTVLVDHALSIAVDSSFIYVAGFQGTGGDCSNGGDCWRIEKRDITAGTPVTAFDSDGLVTSDPTSGVDRLSSIAIDSSFIYVAGLQATGGDCSVGSACWRIEKRNITSGALVAAFDSDGVVTSDPTSSADVVLGITVDSGSIYVAGYQGTGGDCSAGGFCWRMEKRDKS